MRTLIARNVRLARQGLRLRQSDVGNQMADLGWESWRGRGAVVSVVERGQRSLLAEELPALAAVLRVDVPWLLSRHEDTETLLAMPAAPEPPLRRPRGRPRRAQQGTGLRDPGAYQGSPPVAFRA